MMTVHAYVRGSTDEQRLTLEAQSKQIRDFVRRRGWGQARYHRETGSARNFTDRPVFTALRNDLAAGDVLVVADLSRVSRSVCDFATLVAAAGREGWSLACLDPEVDTSTNGGRLLANILAAIAEWERDEISKRTRRALAEAKAQGTVLGAPSAADEKAITTMARLRGEGLTFEGIAHELNRRKIPRADLGRDRRRGKAWTYRAVRNSLVRARVHEPVSTKPSQKKAHQEVTST